MLQAHCSDCIGDGLLIIATSAEAGSAILESPLQLLITMVGRGGFEPPMFTTWVDDLQSSCFNPLHICPYLIPHHAQQRAFTIEPQDDVTLDMNIRVFEVVFLTAGLQHGYDAVTVAYQAAFGPTATMIRAGSPEC
jgi:hypothetical protein